MSDTLTNALSSAARSSSVLEGIANPAQLNPLAGMGSAMELVGRMQGLDKNQAEQSLGQAYAKAVDPTTGRFDPLKFNQIAAADPRAAYAMKSGMESSQSLQGAQFTLNRAQNDQINSAVTAALAEKDPARMRQAVLEQTMRLVDAGVIPRDRAMASLLNLSNDPNTMRGQLETLRVQSLPPDQQQQVIYGSPFRQTGPGGATIGGTQDLRSGAVSGPASQPGLAQGLSPEQLNQPHSYMGRDGKMVNGTVGSFLKEMGVTTGMPGSGGRGGGGGTVDLGNGRRVPGALTNPNKPASGANPDVNPDTGLVDPGGTLRPSTAPSRPQPTPAGGLGTPLPTLQPGEETVIQDRAKAASAAFDNDQKQGDAAQQQLATLGNIQSDIAKFTTGSGAGRTLDFKRAAQSWAPPLAKAFGITPTEIAGQEDFLKNVATLQLAQGSSTDKRLDVVGHMTPTDNLSPEGVDLITRKLQGNADYLRARAKLSREFKGNRLTYDEFQGSVANLDPRVFQVQRMSKPQRDEYFASLTDDAKRELLAARQKARQMGALP